MPIVFRTVVPFVVVTAFSAVLGCTPPPTPVSVCSTAGDCNVDERCDNGVCVPSANEGEGEGELAGNDDAAVVAAVCERATSCGVVDDAPSCLAQIAPMLAGFRSEGREVCTQTADAFNRYLVCLTGQACVAFQDPAQSPCAPLQQAATDLQSQCDSGEGEGEGSGVVDPPPGPLCEQAFAFDDAFGSFDFELRAAEFEPASDSVCTNGIAVHVLGVAFGTDLQLFNRAEASFDGTQIVELLNADIDAAGSQVSGILCAQDDSVVLVAMHIVSDALTSSASCTDVLPAGSF